MKERLFLDISVSRSDYPRMVLPEELNEVDGSKILRFLMSTNKPNRSRKSAPKMGVETSAIIKTQGNFLLRPISNCNSFFPNVRIVEPFAACNLRALGLAYRLIRALSLGNTETIAPLSIKYLIPDTRSRINRRLNSWLASDVAETDVPISFPGIHKEDCIYVHFC